MKKQSWTKAQKDFLNKKRSLIRDVDGKLTGSSFLNLSETPDVIRIYDYFIKCIKSMIDNGIFETGYLTEEYFMSYEFLGKHSKKYLDLDYSKFNIDHDTLKSYIYAYGSFFPIMMTINEMGDLETIECSYSQYQSIALVDLYRDSLMNGREVLYFIKDFEGVTPFEAIMDVPVELYDTVYNTLELVVAGSDLDTVSLTVTDSRDAWLIFKILQKEVSYLFMHNWMRLISDGVRPDIIMNRIVE